MFFKDLYLIYILYNLKDFYAQKHINPWLINWTDNSICEKKLYRKKLFALYIASILPNIEKAERPCLHNKVAMLGDVMSEEQEPVIK